MHSRLKDASRDVHTPQIGPVQIKCIWHPWSDILWPHGARDVSGGVLGPRVLDAELEEAVEVARRKAVHLDRLSLRKKV